VIVAALVASPVATRQYVETLPVCLDRAQTLKALIAMLYQAGAYMGSHGGAEVVGLLWQLTKTYTGKVDVSRQLVDGSNPSIDGILYADFMASYKEQVESAVAALDALSAPAGLGVVISYPGSPAYANLRDAFIAAAASVGKRRKQPPRVVLCGLGSWSF
jgi:hypothetical protein